MTDELTPASEAVGVRDGSTGRRSSRRGSSGPMRLAAAVGALLGPGGAWLRESGRIEPLGGSSLLDLWVVVGMAAVGAALGACAAARGARWSGGTALLLNSAVALLYGFLAVFFGAGGSR